MRLKRKIKIKRREIKSRQIKGKIKEVSLRANYHINLDLMNRLTEALKDETSPRCILRVISSRSLKTGDGKNYGC